VGGSVALDGQWAGAALTKRGAEAWVYIAKNRSGPTAEVRFEWVGPRYLFRLPTDWTERNPALVDDESIIDHSAQALPAGDDPDAALFGDGSATPDPGAPTETPLLGEGGSPSEPDEAAGDSDEAAELFA
jgi:hypothetical protein